MDPGGQPDGRRGRRPLLGNAGACCARTSPMSAPAGSRASSVATRAKDHVRSALLVAGLAGLGRISTDTANSLNRKYGLALGHTSSWTQDHRCRRCTPAGGDGAGPDRHRIPDAVI